MHTTAQLSHDNVALRAAALSFTTKKAPNHPSSASTHPQKRAPTGSASTSPLSPLRRSNPPLWPHPRSASKEQRTVAQGSHRTPQTSPTHLRSASALTASQVAFTRSSILGQSTMEKELPSVKLRTRLFQDDTALAREDATVLPPSMHKATPEHSRPASPEKGHVDSSSIDGISALKNMFEDKGVKKSMSPALNPDHPLERRNRSNVSLTAAVLATQLSPQHSSSASRHGSPERVVSSSRSSPKHRRFHSENNVPQLVPPEQEHPHLQIGASYIRPRSSRESIVSGESSTDTTRSSALTAATLAQAASPARSPEKSPSRPAPVKAYKSHQPPQPPAPRRTKAYLPDAPHGTSYEGSATTNTKPLPPMQPRRSAVPLSSSTTSLPLFQRPSPSPPPLPERATRESSPAKHAALLSATPALSRKASITSIKTVRTGDSIPALAASLAPSRANTPGPRKQRTPAPAPPPPRRRRSLPLPPKPLLKETLRKPRKDPRSPSPKPPRTALAKHNHHAEALRHQWRWHITERERKRYEGLWAANRGLLQLPHQRNYVLNVVVRDIWRRSRLDPRTLGDIWDLVDRGQKGALSREEFCVGAWLIDQALKGKKVPTKVEESVWESVRVIVLPHSVPMQRGRRRR
jgi:hypothetical protein